MELFTVSPSQVVHRALRSFVPGRHASLLVAPDLYGPLVAVLLLPQVLLLAMDSIHLGCTRSDLLGDAVMVVLFLWGLLTCIYRFLAYFVAPALSTKHCTCLVGYGFFSWSVSILCSIIAEHVRYLPVSPQLVLIVLGILPALAQGVVFWEQLTHSPSAASLLTAQDMIPSWPPQIRRWTDRHTALSERVLWFAPKILVCALVAGFQYQFMWYVARVFLPGREHFCRLSALMNPANYADIISQKEFRDFVQHQIIQKGKIK